MGNLLKVAALLMFTTAMASGVKAQISDQQNQAPARNPYYTNPNNSYYTNQNNSYYTSQSNSYYTNDNNRAIQAAPRAPCGRTTTADGQAPQSCLWDNQDRGPLADPQSLR